MKFAASVRREESCLICLKKIIRSATDASGSHGTSRNSERRVYNDNNNSNMFVRVLNIALADCSGTMRQR